MQDQNTVEHMIGLIGRSLWFLRTAKQVNVTTAEPDLKIAVFFQKFHDLVFSILHAYACTYTNVLVCHVTTTCVLDQNGMDA